MGLGLQARSIGPVYGVGELGMGIPFDFRIVILISNLTEFASASCNRPETCFGAQQTRATKQVGPS